MNMRYCLHRLSGYEVFIFFRVDCSFVFLSVTLVLPLQYLIGDAILPIIRSLYISVIREKKR